MRTALLILTAWLLVTLAVLSMAPGPDDVARVLEDDPRWNCQTMGNRTCGTVPR